MRSSSTRLSSTAPCTSSCNNFSPRPCGKPRDSTAQAATCCGDQFSASQCTGCVVNVDCDTRSLWLTASLCPAAGAGGGGMYAGRWSDSLDSCNILCGTMHTA
eukprot:724770-Amphidinium_carterae.2